MLRHIALTPVPASTLDGVGAVRRGCLALPGRAFGHALESWCPGMWHYSVLPLGRDWQLMAVVF